MTFFTKNEIEEKNNTLLIVCIVLVLIFSIFVMIKFENLLGVLIPLFCVILCGVTIIVFIN